MLSLRLKRRSGGALVGATLTVTLTVTLAALLLALFPAVAEAQAEAQTKDKSAPSAVVVQPGDSLWSISEERLAPNASPRRIVRGAEQIYALNRGLIGADPDLIFVGQELLVPPVMSERPTGTTPAHKTAGKTTEAAQASEEAGPRDRTAKGTTGKAPQTAPGGPDAKGGDVFAPVAEREAQMQVDPVSLPVLPDEAEAAPVPAVRLVTSNDAQRSPVSSFLRTIRTEFASAASSLVGSLTASLAEWRRLLGLGVLLLTLVVAAFVVWKLPMRLTTREDAERWGIPMGYYYASPAAHRNNVPLASRPGSPGERDPEAVRLERTQESIAPQQRGIPTGNGAAPVANGARTAAVACLVRKAKPKPKASPRNGLALGAHNPEVRSASLLARVPRRARKPRPLGRVARPPRVSAPEQKRGGERR